MKNALFVLGFLFLCLPIVIQGQIKHKVELNNGTVIRGKILETEKQNVVLIKTLDGSFYHIPLTDVREINKTSWTESRRSNMDRPFGVFLRPEIGLGFGCSASLSLGLQTSPIYAFYGGVETNQLWDPSSKRGFRCIINCFFLGNRIYLNPQQNSWFLDFCLGTGTYTTYATYKYNNNYYYDSNGIDYAGYYHYSGTLLMTMLGVGKTFGPIDIGLHLSAAAPINDFLTIYTWDPSKICFTMAYNLRKIL